MEAALVRHGLPAPGAWPPEGTRPALQVLPLALALAWEPVEPGRLLDFLTNPISPVASRAARALARALADQPGLGSRTWTEAVEALTRPEADPDGRHARDIEDWLGGPRVRRGEPLPAAVVATIAGRVATWAGARSGAMEAEARAEPAKAAMFRSLRAAAGQAAVVASLASERSFPYSEAQLGRVLEDTRATAHAGARRPAEVAAPRLVAGLEELDGPCDRLIWLGLSARNRPTIPWSRHELAALADAGVPVDDGSADVAALRAAERRGLLRVARELVAVELPGDDELRAHPVWVRIQAGLGDQGHPVGLEAHIATGGEASPPETAEGPPPAAAEQPTRWWPALEAPRVDLDVEPPPPRRALWRVDVKSLPRRERVSASDLDARLCCPLKWVLAYPARLRPPRSAELPDGALLAGQLGHAVMERVFGHPGPPPAEDEAARLAVEDFDAHVARDAAPLAQPARLVDRHRLRDALAHSARVLARALAAGGYEVVGMEMPIAAEILVGGDRRAVGGSIDCVARAPDGHEAIIDLKYGRRRWYRGLLEAGGSSQLATYAAARAAAAGTAEDTGRAADLDATTSAYLFLADGYIVTPEGRPLAGATPAMVVQQAPSAGEVWRRLSDALARGAGWIRGDEPVPARPLQRPDRWPRDAQRFIDPEGRQSDERRAVCRYCDYGVLCGLERLT
jgi:hypothetical protein